MRAGGDFIISNLAFFFVLSEASPVKYVPYNSWVMVTYTYDFISPTDVVYTTCVNSTCSSSVQSMTQPDTYINEAMFIFGTYQLIGDAANAQVYNVTLTQSQISQLYSEGLSGAPISNAGLVGWWPLDGNANDYSGNNNNGAAANVNWVSP